MKLKELLDELQEIADQSDCSQPFLCGGASREKFMNNLSKVDDLDFTNGDKSILRLSQLFADRLGERYALVRKEMDDGHSSIFLGNMKLDFSSNFNAPHIEGILKLRGIKQPSEIQKEMFSRDFTCNALLLTLDLKTCLDPTLMGFNDIKNKKIRTCLDPKITLTTNRNRVARAIYLACKLGFDIDQRIIDYVSTNPQSIKISTEKSLNEKIEKAFEYDSEKAIYYLNKMNLWNYINITTKIYPHYLKAKA